MNAVTLWRASIRLHRMGFTRLARALKAINYVVFHAVLPPEAELGARVELGHYGLGVVIHPNVTIGTNVFIWHGVTLAVSGPPGSPHRIHIEDGVTIGAGVVVVTRYESSLTIGARSVIGANSVVTRDVIPDTVVAGSPARVLRRIQPT